MRIYFSILASLALGLFAQISCAESLGVYGKTYQIKEADAIETFKKAAQKKLANGGQEKMLKDAQDRYLASINNIEPPPGITAVKQASVRFVDVSERVQESIKDTKGNVIVAAGTVINPLAVKPLTKKLFFIDAKDIKQLAYVKANANPRDKVIAMGGSVLAASEYLKRHVYMDKNGLYARMKVRAVPSVVSQVGVELKIEELKF